MIAEFSKARSNLFFIIDDHSIEIMHF